MVCVCIHDGVCTGWCAWGGLCVQGGVHRVVCVGWFVCTGWCA